ncbi:serine/threonine kinase [Aureococcus anophagefferens]|nr:serine/threonine kinase [Aureococcus anophagefferens]
MGSGVSSPPKRDRTLPAAPPPAVFHFDDPRPLAVAALGDRLIAGRPWPLLRRRGARPGTFATVQRCAARDATAAALGGGAPVALKTISKRGDADHRRTRGATLWTEILADDARGRSGLPPAARAEAEAPTPWARSPPRSRPRALGVVHRDVKAENLIYADAAATRLVVCDWGLAEGDYAFEAPDWDHASADGRAFVAALLRVDRDARMTCADARGHAFSRATGPTLHPAYVSRLEEFNAKRRLKGGAFAVAAACAFQDSVRGRTSRASSSASRRAAPS